MKEQFEPVMYEFTRNMDYINGKAFELTWGQPAKLAGSKENEINSLIVEALTWRPSFLHPVLHEQLKRKLVMMSGNFSDDVFLLLQCLLEAATGEYSMLNCYARNFKILPSSSAHSLYFDVEEDDAA